ncbi:MAG TPA: protein kinase, partial [Vicinamibacteria bacterium]
MNLERIGKYEILGEIGRGTMGTVYKAKDPVLNRFVAIKTMVASPGRNDESKQRFQREAQAAALLAHPNIVTVHDLGEEQGLIFMAMELLEGHDLRDLIASPKGKTLDESLHIMEQVAAGLAFAHSKGVVHRDLKPANIHVQPNRHVKIVDFGLARLGGSDLTMADVVLGTPNYMSPEQALGDKVDARTDVFSAGGVFYELLTGRKPFDAEATPAVLYQVVHKEPQPLRKWAPETPGILVEVVERCLTKDKNLRFQNGRQLRAALGVVRQAFDGGRAETATLAEESQRANEEAKKDGSSKGGIAPAASRAPLTEGSSALSPAAEPRPQPPARSTPTLSGRSSTQRGGRRVEPRGSRALPITLGLAVLFLLGIGLAYWQTRGRFAGGAAPPPGDAAGNEPSRAEVGALTEALVDSQIELALKNLEDKNWVGAIAQAERAMKLQPDSSRAKQILETARGRRGELEAAAAEARRAFEAGNLPEASRAFDHVLELDPKHPVVGELTGRLNSTFRSRAEEAQQLAQRARTEADKAKATTVPGFSEASALLGEGDTLFGKSEFADAAQRYLEARDGFERARRSARAAARAAAVAAAPSPAASAETTGLNVPSAATPSPGLPLDGAGQAGREAPRPFVTGKS